MISPNDLTDDQMKEFAQRCIQLNIESHIMQVENSLFAGKPTSIEVADRMRKKCVEMINKKKYLEPVCYCHITDPDGDEQILGISLRKFVDHGPLFVTALIANIMAEVPEIHAYAVSFSAWVASRPLHEIRADPEIDKFPVRREAIVSYCEYRDGDQTYMVHGYGKSDDVIVWERVPDMCDIPPHAQPGRIWNLIYISDQLRNKTQEIEDANKEGAGE